MNLLKLTEILKPSFLIVILLYCHLLKAQDSTIVKNEPGIRQVQALTVDGKENDWPAVLPYFDKDAGISYSITHNDSMAYICLKPKDDIAQVKIIKAGLTIYIDQSGKKKKACSILFPIPTENESSSGSQLNDLKTMEFMAFMNVKEYRLSGFIKGNGTFNKDQGNDAGVEVKIGFSEKGELIYEAAIPFAAFYPKQKISEEDNGKSIAIGFFIDSFTKPIAPDNNASYSKSSVDRSSQSNSSGNPQPGLEQMRQLYVKTKTWRLINLDSVTR